MNRVIFMGRLTKDPEVKYNNDNAYARFSIAVDRRYKRENEPTADFFNCVAFGKTAEFVEKYLNKGTKILLSGRVENNNYTDKEGKTVYGTRIVVEEIEFAESKKASGESEKENAQKPNNPSNDGFMNVPDGIDEELPFN